MPNSELRKGNARDDPSPHELRNTAETLSNIFYLVEQTVDDPKSIRELLKMAERPMEMLKNLASRHPIVEEDDEAPEKPYRLSPDGQAADRVHPLPLAASSEGAPLWSDSPSHEDRIEEPETE